MKARVMCCHQVSGIVEPWNDKEYDIGQVWCDMDAQVAMLERIVGWRMCAFGGYVRYGHLTMRGTRRYKPTGEGPDTGYVIAFTQHEHAYNGFRFAPIP